MQADGRIGSSEGRSGEGGGNPSDRTKLRMRIRRNMRFHALMARRDIRGKGGRQECSHQAGIKWGKYDTPAAPGYTYPAHEEPPDYCRS